MSRQERRYKQNRRKMIEKLAKELVSDLQNEADRMGCLLSDYDIVSYHNLIMELEI